MARPAAPTGNRDGPGTDGGSLAQHRARTFRAQSETEALSDVHFSDMTSASDVMGSLITRSY